MLLFDKYLKHVFITPKMSEKLIERGVNMNDAQFYIISKDGKEYVVSKKEITDKTNAVPTYSIADFMYKLHEWIAEEDGDKKFSGPLGFIKDAPFYIFTYYNKDDNKSENEDENYHFKRFFLRGYYTDNSP